MDYPFLFGKKLKKAGLPSEIIALFEHVREKIFEYSQFDICAPINGARKLNANYSRATVF